MEAKDTKSTSSPEVQSKPAGVGEILVKKQCEHPKCPIYRCERKDLRIGGIDI